MELYLKPQIKPVALVLDYYTHLIEQEHVYMLKEHIRATKVDDFTRIMAMSSFKDAHMYCVINNISSQRYGPLLEHYLIKKYHFSKNSATACNGDCSKDGVRYEVKASLGGKDHTKFNYVQLRPSHAIDYYLFTAYVLTPANVETKGELCIFRIPSPRVKQMILACGGYAHGTIKKNGKITEESLFDNTNIKEYALRPIIGGRLWDDMLTYRVDEYEL